MQWCWGAALMLVCVPLPAIASLPTETGTTSEAPTVNVSALIPPPRLELPPLGDAEQFLPDATVIRLVIRLSDRRVYLYHNDEVKVSYPIAVGKQGWETPTGSYEVMQMIRNPVWEHPWTGEIVPAGPDNPLGSRWIGFWTDGTNVIGFHGTPNEDSVGQAASHGCVRMFDRDVVSLFEQVEIGTPVTVEP